MSVTDCGEPEYFNGPATLRKFQNLAKDLVTQFNNKQSATILGHLFAAGINQQVAIKKLVDKSISFNMFNPEPDHYHIHPTPYSSAYLYLGEFIHVIKRIKLTPLQFKTRFLRCEENFKDHL